MPTIVVPLSAQGPLISVLVGISVPREEAMRAAGQNIAAPIIGTFLIDTGASCTCCDIEFLKPLGLVPTGRMGIMTPSTAAGARHVCDQYDVSLFLTSGNHPGGHLIQAIPVITTHLKTQGIEGLIGRDVLNGCTLIYHGESAFCSLSY